MLIETVDLGVVLDLLFGRLWGAGQEHTVRDLIPQLDGQGFE